MQRVGNPVPVFFNARGTLLDGGHIYIGVASSDPQVSPLIVYADAELTTPIDQPLRTIGGQIVDGATPTFAFVNADDYSMRVTDSSDVLVSYTPSVRDAQTSYQPLDSDLTLIAEQGTTDFGRSLLELANQDALATATGIQPFTGGVVNSNIIRQSGGAYTYWAQPGVTAGRFFITSSSASDPTSAPGDVWYIV